MRKLISANGIGIALIAIVLALITYTGYRESPTPMSTSRLGGPQGPGTSRADLTRTIEQMEARLRVSGLDRDAAILFADASMRQARVTGNRVLIRGAAEAVERILSDEPLDYEARRMLATVYASEHRFDDALREARRARDQQPHDPWNYGIIGDSHLELGEYEKAFEAFQTMLDMRSSAGAYARVSYAFELQGRLDDALEAMRLAVDAASPRDPESLAWFNAHLADLYMDLGRLPEARMAYAWAERAFPHHPVVRAGVAKLMEAEGNVAGAIEIYRQEFERVGTPDFAVALGDAYARTGNTAAAERMYEVAETRWRSSGPAEQDHLARFLAEHDRHLEETVRLAEGSAAQDIFAQDALAWAYYKVGRLAEADRAATRALRTGTRNLEILYHAAAIRRALGDDAGARDILDRAPSRTRRYVRAAAAVRELRSLLAPPQRIALR